jgi:hypothetical protein
MKTIKVYKGMQFNGFDDKPYEVIEVTKDATIEVDYNDINEFLMKLEYSGMKRVPVIPTSNNESLPDDMFLFRLAVVIGDEDVIFTNGTFTWLDDICNLAQHKIVLPDPTANTISNILIKLSDMLNDAEWNTAREIPEVDVLNTAILDAGYELYTELVERMLTYNEKDAR